MSAHSVSWWPWQEEHTTVVEGSRAGRDGGGRSLAEALAAYAEAPSAQEADDPESARFRSPITFPSFLLHVLKVLDAPCADTDDTTRAPWTTTS